MLPIAFKISRRTVRDWLRFSAASRGRAASGNANRPSASASTARFAGSRSRSSWRISPGRVLGSSRSARARIAAVRTEESESCIKWPRISLTEGSFRRPSASMAASWRGGGPSCAAAARAGRAALSPILPRAVAAGPMMPEAGSVSFRTNEAVARESRISPRAMAAPSRTGRETSSRACTSSSTARGVFRRASFSAACTRAMEFPALESF